MTAQEAAIYARRHVQTIYLALREYVQTGGKRGLRGSQSGPNATWGIERPDIDAWRAGQQPAKRR
jgi:hypothetical protein